MAEGEVLAEGRRMFDLGVGPWGDNPVFHAPCFVVSHRPAEKLEREGGTSYTFVTDGIESALEQARAAAGGKTVMVVGGASIVDQYVGAGLVDEIVIHLGGARGWHPTVRPRGDRADRVPADRGRRRT
jgi:dihydrofolate reductase